MPPFKGEPFQSKKRSDLALHVKREPFWLKPFWKTALFSEVELFFFSKHDYEEKNGSPLQKRADFQNYFSREPFWLSFFSQCTFKNTPGMALPISSISSVLGFTDTDNSVWVTFGLYMYKI